MENATDTLQVIAKDIKIQVDFDKQTVNKFRLIGYENKTLAHQDFRNDKITAGEIGPNHSATALYEIELNEGVKEGKIANVSLRFKDVDGSNKTVELSKDIFVKELKTDFNQASHSFRLASVVGLYGEILRESYWLSDNRLQDVTNLANKLNINEPKISEFRSIVKKASELKLNIF